MEANGMIMSSFVEFSQSLPPRSFLYNNKRKKYSTVIFNTLIENQLKPNMCPIEKRWGTKACSTVVVVARQRTPILPFSLSVFTVLLRILNVSKSVHESVVQRCPFMHFLHWKWPSSTKLKRTPSFFLDWSQSKNLSALGSTFDFHLFLQKPQPT